MCKEVYFFFNNDFVVVVVDHIQDSFVVAVVVPYSLEVHVAIEPLIADFASASAYFVVVEDFVASDSFEVGIQVQPEVDHQDLQVHPCTHFDPEDLRLVHHEDKSEFEVAFHPFDFHNLASVVEVLDLLVAYKIGLGLDLENYHNSGLENSCTVEEVLVEDLNLDTLTYLAFDLYSASSGRRSGLQLGA